MNIIFGYCILLIGIIGTVSTSVSFASGELLDIIQSYKARKLSPRKYRPMVSIVISAFNEEKVIYRSLESIMKSSYKRFEVIVINDGSKDNTAEEILRFKKEHKLGKKVIFVSQVNSGKAHALNNGIMNYAKGQIVMCLDADSILAENALEKAVRHFRDKKVGAIAATVRVINENTILSILQGIEYIYSYRQKKARTFFGAEYIIGGVGSTFRRSLLKECGYYDTDSLTEDIAFTLKIISKKGNKDSKIVYASDVVCYTEGVANLKALFKQRYRWKYGFLQAMFKNHKLILSNDKRVTKSLTWGYIPLALYGELLSLIDPILLLFVIFYSIQRQTPSLFAGMFLFILFYTIFTLVTDEYLSTKEKLIYLYYSPIAYIYFVVLGLLGDIALIKCIINWKGIIYMQKVRVHTWDTVRSGYTIKTN